MATRARFRAGSDLLADLDLHQLQHAGESRAHLQLVVLPFLQLQDGSDLFQVRLLDRQPRPHRFNGAGDLLLRDVVANRELLGVHLRLLQIESRDELVFRERFLHLPRRLGFVEFGLDGCRRRALLELIVLDLHAKVGQRRLGGADLQLGVVQLLFELRVGQLQDHAVGFHRGAGAQDDLVDAPLRGRRNPADVFRHQRAEAAHLAEHRARV